MDAQPDAPPRVVIVGGGHNGLVAAAYLARAGLAVEVLERLGHTGGAAVSAQAFPGHDARLSRFSYLVSLMPDDLVADLGLRLELRSRDVASYTPYEREGVAAGLLVETDEGEATRASFRALTGSDAEHDAWQRFYAEVATLSAAVAPTLLRPLPRVGDVRDATEPAAWTDVVEAPLGTALERRFSDNVVRGVVGTDALIGTFASLHDTTLVQNRCFLYHLVGGEWRVPVGGMGAVTGELERVAREAGATIRTGAEVTRIESSPDGVVVHVGDERVEADFVLSNVAPHVLAGLTGRPRPPKPSGAQLKVNLLLSRLPRLRSGDDPRRAFAGTFHIDEAMSQLEDAWATAAAGGAPRACGELYCHTLTDRSILGPELADGEAQTLTYFGLHAPYENLPDAEAGQAACRDLITALERHLAEPLEPLLLGVEVKTPAEVEAELNMPGGHIFHGDLAWPWLDEDEQPQDPAERWGVATPDERILVCGSGSRRGGAVSGLGGHSAAHALLELLKR